MDFLRPEPSAEYEIAQAFLDLIREKPYEKINVKELTGACSISRTQFYRYFDDILDLLDNIERSLLASMSLYHAASDIADSLAGKPFDSTVRWFENGIKLRSCLGPLMSENGDVYFRVRLLSQVKRELSSMMDDDRAPQDRLRPYYVELSAAAHIGLLAHLVTVDDDAEIPDARELATIANSVRVAYYQCSDDAPSISREKLFGSD